MEGWAMIDKIRAALRNWLMVGELSPAQEAQRKRLEEDYPDVAELLSLYVRAPILAAEIAKIEDKGAREMSYYQSRVTKSIELYDQTQMRLSDMEQRLDGMGAVIGVLVTVDETGATVTSFDEDKAYFRDYITAARGIASSLDAQTKWLKALRSIEVERADFLKSKFIAHRRGAGVKYDDGQGL
jgi:hypothetical protein